MNINNIMAKKTIYPKHLDWNINYSEREEAVLGFLQVLIPPLRAAVLFDKHIQFFFFLIFRISIFAIIFFIFNGVFLADFNNPYFLIIGASTASLFAYIVYHITKILSKFTGFAFAMELAIYTFLPTIFMGIIFSALMLFELLLATVAFYLYILDVIISFVSLALKSEWFKI